MARLLRPLIFVGVISFMLGLWLSLRRAESNLFAHLREPRTITILTDEPEWWHPLVRKARQDGVAEVQLLTPSRRRWGDLLSSKTPKCHLVTTSSFFVSQFASHHWLDAQSTALDKARDQIHPDFRDLGGSGKPEFLPLLWSVTLWSEEKSPDPSARLAIHTSLDEALLVALDLHPGEMDMVDPDTTDPIELVRQLWAKVEDEVTLSLKQSEYAVPLSSVKARQLYASQVSSPVITPTENLPNNGQANLWYYGAGVCPGQLQSSEIQEFVQWLLRPENMALLANESGMSVTVSAAENERLPANQRPSFLRQLPLGMVKGRELPWDLAAAWMDFWHTPQDNAASR